MKANHGHNRLILDDIMNFHGKLARRKGYAWARWVKYEKSFSEDEADAFFLNILLNQHQPSWRAEEGANHLVENHFQDGDNFWECVLDTHHQTVRHICQKGYRDKSYALRDLYKKFPLWLRRAAKRIVDRYDSDVINVWDVDLDQVNVIFTRLRKFDGIGDELAKMGQFILVRQYGIAGGRKAKSKLSFKADSQAIKVIYRTGISPDIRKSSCIKSVKELGVKSEADFDAAVWTIGKEYCHPGGPLCGNCPIESTCRKVGLPN